MPETAAPPRSTRSVLASTPYRFTQEEYVAMAEAGILAPDASVELIDGHIVEVRPENSFQRIAVAKASERLIRALENLSYFVQTQSTLPLDELNMPEPDLAVLRGEPDDVLRGEPEIVLVVEVADTSLDQDRSVKQALYAERDVSEYWILNLQNRTLEVYWDPGEREYRQRRTLYGNESVVPRFEDTLSFQVEALLPARSKHWWTDVLSRRETGAHSASLQGSIGRHPGLFFCLSDQLGHVLRQPLGVEDDAMLDRVVHTAAALKPAGILVEGEGFPARGRRM